MKEERRGLKEEIEEEIQGLAIDLKDEIRAMKDEIKAVTDKIKELSATMTNKASPAPNIKAFDKFRRCYLVHLIY